MPINPNTPGVSGSWTVNRGDTLQGIAAAAWGNSSLWYLIAEANGLSAASSLVPGQLLRLPPALSSRNATDTFRPYDPSQALGDLSPTRSPIPKAPKGPKCGVFGQILLAAVAVAVTALLPGGGTILGAAINGMIGSAVSQGVGLVTGIQDKFSFKSMAMAGLTAGVGVGLDKVGLAVNLGSKVASAAVNGMIASAVTQGIAVATGLQSKFSFTNVAVAGIVAGVGQAVSDAMPGKALTGDARAAAIKAGTRYKPTFGNNAVSGMAGTIAGAAARSLITGTSFGDNIIAVLPDVIASTIGRAISDRQDIAARKKAAAAREWAEGVTDTGVGAASMGAAMAEVANSAGAASTGAGSGGSYDPLPYDPLLLRGFDPSLIPSALSPERMRANAFRSHDAWMDAQWAELAGTLAEKAVDGIFNAQVAEERARMAELGITEIDYAATLPNSDNAPTFSELREIPPRPSQGIGVATGLQKKFGFTSVAVAGGARISCLEAETTPLTPHRAKNFLAINCYLGRYLAQSADWAG